MLAGEAFEAVLFRRDLNRVLHRAPMRMPGSLLAASEPPRTHSRIAGDDHPPAKCTPVPWNPGLPANFSVESLALLTGTEL